MVISGQNNWTCFKCRLLREFLCHQASCVALHWFISISLDLEHPSASNGLLGSRGTSSKVPLSRDWISSDAGLYQWDLSGSGRCMACLKVLGSPSCWDAFMAWWAWKAKSKFHLTQTRMFHSEICMKHSEYFSRKHLGKHFEFFLKFFGRKSFWMFHLVSEKVKEIF